MILPRLVLIVEDDLLQREAIAETLKLEGMDVIECESAEAAELVRGEAGTLVTRDAQGLELADVA